MRAKPLIKNFLAGEIAPQLDGLVDAPIQGCRTLENFIVRKQGGLQRRPGTFYAGEVKTSSLYTRIISFESTTGVHYIIELGNLYARFWKQSTHAVMGGVGSETEVVTPYLTAELRGIKYVVIKDSIYFTHQNHPIQRLTWTSDTSWTWAQAPVHVNSKIIVVGHDLFSWITEKEDLSEEWERLENSLFDLTNPGNLRGICWGNGIWVMVGPVGRISISYDGKIWTPVDTGETTDFFGIEFNGSLFIATTTNAVWISIDGITWKEKALGSASDYYTSSYKPSVNRYIVAGKDHLEMYSDDGVTWISGGDTQFSTSEHINDSCYGNERFVVVGTAGKISTSSDGINWTARTSGITNDIYAIKWIEELSLFVALGEGKSILTSPDAITWTIRENIVIPKINQWYSVCWSPALSLFCAVSVDGTHRVMISSDGVLWRVPDVIYDITWDGNRAVACGSNGLIISSQDLITWVSHTIVKEFIPTFRAIAIDYLADYWRERFNETSHYPRACTCHEGRLLVGGSLNDSGTIWGSKTNLYMTFFMGTFDDDAWDIVLGGRKQSRILWLEGASKLVVGTDSREGTIEGGSSGITASVRGVKWQSTYGSDDTLQGMLVNDLVIFAQRNATIVRALQYKQEQQTPVDLTYYADHIAIGGIKEWDFQNSPESILWAIRNDGTLLSLSFEPALQILAWARHISRTDDFESVAVVGGSTEDEIWFVMKRSVDGSTVRYLEYMDVRNFGNKADAHFVDCGKETTMSGTAVGSLTHIAAETVDVLIDGNIVESHIVTSLGTITLDHTCNAEVVHVGLPFDSTLQTTRLRTGSPWGEGVGLKKMIPKIWAWIYETIGGKFGPEKTVTESRAYTSATDLETDMIEVKLPPKYNDDGYIWVIQDDPLPMTLLAISPEVRIGDK